MILTPGQTHAVCSDCEEELPIDRFTVNARGQYPDGSCRYNQCKDCRYARHRDRRLTGYRTAKTENPRHWFYNNLRVKHGLGPDDVDDLLILSSGLCAICDKAFKNTKNEPHLDHDHKTGEVREFLCSRCNTMVGLIEDFRFLKRAVDYVKMHRKRL